MNRLWQIFRKNIMLLLRSKSSAFMILFGPLFIILLVGLAFTGTSSYDLSLGYFAPEESPLMNRFLQNMETEGFIIESFDSIEECTVSLKQGSLQACMLFPEDFVIENNKTNEIIFFVDESRTNFVYQIIDSVSKNLGVESAELSADLTGDILNVLWLTDTGIQEAIGDTIKLKAGVTKLEGSADEASSTADSIDLEGVDADTNDVEDNVADFDDLMDDLRSSTDSMISKGKTLSNELNASAYSTDATVAFNSALASLETKLTTNEEDGQAIMDAFDENIQIIEEALESIENKLTEADDARDEILDLVVALKDDATSIKEDLDDLKSALEALTARINTLHVTSSETISKPIVTKIEYLSSKSSKLSFMFPYLLLLVVMFIGLLLSGTLIIMEKKSKSSFRTFCSPTSDSLFMFGNFLTSLVILVVQLSILLAIGYYFLGDLLLANIGVSFVVLLLGIMLFILLGMAIGYMLQSQEAVTMISISIASIFLFLSNLILPIETLSEQLRAITYYNPYVLGSEALRQALLFGASYDQLQRELFILIGYSLLLFIFIIVARRTMKSRILARLSVARHRKIFEDPSDMYLVIGRTHLKSLRDLLEWLQSVDDKTFTSELTWKEIREWLVRSHQSRHLRVRLAGKTRKKMIKVLKKWLEKHK